MATTDFPTDGIAGANFNRRTTDAEFAVGQTARGSANTAWVYVKASGTIATGTCTVATATFLAVDGSGSFSADTAFGDGDYGWVRVTAQDLPG